MELQYGSLHRQAALFEASQPQWPDVEGRTGAAAYQLSHSLSRRQRVHDAVTTEAGALDELGEARCRADDRVVVHGLRVEAGPALPLIDGNARQERKPVANPLGDRFQEPGVNVVSKLDGSAGSE